MTLKVLLARSAQIVAAKYGPLTVPRLKNLAVSVFGQELSARQARLFLGELEIGTRPLFEFSLNLLNSTGELRGGNLSQLLAFCRRNALDWSEIRLLDQNQSGGMRFRFVRSLHKNFPLVEVGLEGEIKRSYERFANGLITRRDDFKQELLRVFEEACGRYGREEFEKHVLFSILEVYGGNISQAGVRAVLIIEEGASRPKLEIGNYFKKVLSREMRELNKGLIELPAVIETIDNLLRTFDEKALGKDDNHFNVCGAIIVGSYARGDIDLHSDLELIVLLRDPNSIEEPYADLPGGRIFFDPAALRRDLALFSRELEARTGRKVSVLESLGIHNTAEIIPLVFGEKVEGKYVVASPFDSIRNYLTGVLGERLT